MGVLDGKVSRRLGQTTKAASSAFRKKKRLSKVSVPVLRVVALADHMIQGLGWGGGANGWGTQ